MSAYTPEVTRLAAEIYAYDTMDDSLVYANDKVQEEYLERALFITHSDWLADHDATAAGTRSKADPEDVLRTTYAALIAGWQDGASPRSGAASIARALADKFHITERQQ